MISKLLTAAILTVGTTFSAQAVTLTATFDSDSFFGDDRADINDIIEVTVSDLAGGGVEVEITGNDDAVAIGSVFIGGFDETQFTGGTTLTALVGSTNQYPFYLGTSGVILADIALSGGATAVFTSVPAAGLTTDDFLGAAVGMVTTSVINPNIGTGSYGGTLGQIVPAPVPLPAGLPLLLLGLGAVGIASRRPRKQVLANC